MLLRLILSLLFILPLFGSLSVLFKGILSEIRKKNIDDQKFSGARVVGFSILSVIGIYITLFIVWLIWFPNIELPYSLKVASFCIAAPYILGVIGVGWALKKATEFGASPSKMASSLANSMSSSKDGLSNPTTHTPSAGDSAIRHQIGLNMITANLLRVCVVAWWIFFILSIWLSFEMQIHLPTSLNEWVISEAERNPTTVELIIIIASLVMLLTYLVSSIGLLLLNRWGAWLFLISLIIEYIYSPFTGPIVDHAITNTFSELSDLLSGLIIGLAFFSNSLKKAMSVNSEVSEGIKIEGN